MADFVPLDPADLAHLVDRANLSRDPEPPVRPIVELRPIRWVHRRLVSPRGTVVEVDVPVYPAPGPEHVDVIPVGRW